MLSIRQRGTKYYVRGVVQEGRQKERVAEHSTGRDTEAEAKAYADRLEKDIRARLTLGLKPDALKPAVRTSVAITRYIEKMDPKNGDLSRLSRLLEGFRDKPLNEIDPAAWEEFCREHMPGCDANTRARMQTTLRSVFTEAGEGVKFDPDIKHGSKRSERVRWLPADEADRLIDAYAYEDPSDGRRSAQAPHARQIGLVLRYMGPRSSECLQIQRPHVDLARGAYGAVWIPPSKNGEARWLPIHPIVRPALLPLLEETRPIFLDPERGPLDPLFLTDKRKPYRDPRIHGDGGNPMSKMHRSACARAGITDFTPHDWRHHWATMCVRGGMDLITLQMLGGWKDLSMVQRYAAPDFDHAGALLARTG
jgi:integrase